MSSIVRLLTVEVLEVGELDALPHAEDITGGADTVKRHPEVSGVQGGDGVCRGVAGPAEAGQSVLNVGPGGDDGAENHQTEGEQGHGGDRATEPEDLSICNQDDCKVLEDGVYGDREELESPGAGVDHANEEERNGEPCFRSDNALGS